MDSDISANPLVSDTTEETQANVKRLLDELLRTHENDDDYLLRVNLMLIRSAVSSMV